MKIPRLKKWIPTKIPDSHYYIMLANNGYYVGIKSQLDKFAKDKTSHYKYSPFKTKRGAIRSVGVEKKQREEISFYKKRLKEIVEKRKELEKKVKEQRKIKRSNSKIAKKELHKIKKEISDYEKYCDQVLRDCRPSIKMRKFQEMEARHYGL